MAHGLFLPIFDELAEPEAVADLAAQAEEAGWDGVFVWDHIAFVSPVEAVADPWVTLAAIACRTARIRLGPMITPLPRRRPIKVAREVVTLDHLSNGRLIFGVGIASDDQGELSATGEQLDAKVRAEMLDEALDLLDQAWTGEELHHRGRHFTADGLSVRPRPIQRPRPPVWVAVRQGKHAPLRRAARKDGVFPVRVQSPDQLADLVAEVHALRPPDAGPFDVAVGGPPGTDSAPYFAAGATWWMVSFPPFELTLDVVRKVIRDGPS